VFAPALLALAVACSEPTKPPQVKPESVTTIEVTPKGASVEVALDAFNPNKVELAASSVDTKITIGGKADIARAVLTTTLVLPPNEHIKVKLPIRIEWTDPVALAALAAAKQSTPYVVEGTVDFAGRNVSVKTPFQINGTMTEAQLAQAAPPAASASASASSSAGARPSASAPPAKR
jgi:LEA14-like dessication related protein